MDNKELQIEILTNVVAGLYKDLAELKASLIVATNRNKELEGMLEGNQFDGEGGAVNGDR